MANSTQKVRGLIESLSDFWLLYFRDIDQLKVLYEGADVLMGNVYLEMLGTLLNASLMDTPLFHKEAFKLVQIRETELTFKKRTSADQSRYVYTAESDMVSAQALQNRIFAVTATLEKDVDFYITPDRRFEFRHDPLNAYTHAEFGGYDSVVRVRSKDPAQRHMRLTLLDSGLSPPLLDVSADGATVTLSYDGPAHGSTATARSLVSALNLHPRVSALLHAELLDDSGGMRSPVAVGTLELQPQAVSPLDGYAVRHIEQTFGGRFTAPRLGSFVARGVEKGDILRLLSGAPHEYIIRTVREDGLYLLPGEALTDLSPASRVDFAILREPDDNEVVGEPINPSGELFQGAADGVIDPVLRRLSSATATFSLLHKGDIIDLQGVSNTGPARILEVIDAHTVALATTGLIAEEGVTWSLYSILQPGALGTGGEIFGKLFRAAHDIFTPNVAGTSMMFYGLPSPTVVAIDKYVSTREVLLAEEFVEAATGVFYAWANKIAAPTRVAFPYLDASAFRVSGRTLRDNTELVRGRDYLVHEDTGQVQPLTVWRTDREIKVDYKYRTVIASGSQPLTRGSNGALVAAVFRDDSAAFNYYDLGQALDIAGVGIFFIEEVRSSTEVRLSADNRLMGYTDPNARFLWTLKPRGQLETANVTAFVQEISFWALDALVDKYALYQTYGYLIHRFDVSSEAYRSLIRGVFQLFMLGPTLERMESAINVVAGLPVIRQDNEILLRYDRGAQQTGTDGMLSATSGVFSAESAEFTDDDISSYIFIADGLSENKLYKIVARLSAIEVRVENLSTDDQNVSWELTRWAEHAIVTTRQTYTLPRTIPVRPALTADSARGVKVFRAFEVLTEAFTVTDSVETPNWWERIQIPERLWPGQTAARRQSTPQLVEHLIKPIDDARIGDPGLRIGSDHLGFVPASGTMPLRHHVAFVVLDSGLKQHLFYISFNPVMFDKLSPSLIRDLEEFVFIARPAYTFIVLSPSSIFKERVRIEEQLRRTVRRSVDGEDGERMVADLDRLRIGPHWKVGNWFRRRQGLNIFAAPTQAFNTRPVLTTSSGARNATIVRYIVEWFDAQSWEPLGIPAVTRVFRATTSPAAGRVEGEDLLTDEDAFYDRDLSQALLVADREVTIGMVKSARAVSLGGVQLPEGAVTWQRGTYGSDRGNLRAYQGPAGQARFVDLTATHAFGASDVGTYVHFLSRDGQGNYGLKIIAVESATTVIVAVFDALVEKTGPWEHLRDLVTAQGANLVFDMARIGDRAMHCIATAEGYEEPLNANAGGFDAAQGDTRYFVGMYDPRPKPAYARPARDVGMFEYPLQIMRRPV